MQRGPAVVPAVHLLKLSTPQCKHILAVYLSQATGACQEQTVSDQQLANILLAEEDEDG